MKYGSNKSAFTLIELMVVISIISLLSSTVLVSLQAARVKAFNVKYVQEMKSLQTALFLYQSTHGGSVPPESGEDKGGINSLDTKLASLVSEGFISKIPHYFGWPANSLPQVAPYAWATYQPSSLVNEYSCRAVSGAEWTPGSFSGILTISTNQNLGLTPSSFISSCNELGGCTSLPLDDGEYNYCLPIGLE